MLRVAKLLIVAGLTVGALGLFAGQVGAVDLEVPPKPTAAPILDQADLVTSQQRAELAARINNEEAASSNEIGILTITTLDGASLEDYSLQVARGWGIGQKERNNGVLLLVARNERKVRIEVGYGLEGALTDAKASQIIRNRITPQFKQGNYYQGISDGLDSIILAIHNEYDANLKEESGKSFNWVNILFFLLFGLSWAGAIFARSKSWWAGGVVGGIVGVVLGFVFGFLFVGIAAIIGLAILGTIIDLLVSRNYSQHKAAGRSPSWWAGGGSGGSSGGSFGGGSFGGGGSSGSW